MIEFILSCQFWAGVFVGIVFTGFAGCAIAALARASARSDEDWQ